MNNDDKLITALFVDNEKAGDAVGDLKEKGYTKNISVITRDDTDGEVKTQEIKDETGDGAISGAATGGVLGGLTGLAAGAISLVVPGVGPLVVTGPLVATWGLTGGALGALAGGLVGALVDAGVSQEEAEQYESKIMEGDVLVAVTTDDEHVDEVKEILDNHDAMDSTTRQYASA